ncbi:hypothetical protein [Streptomyces sp. NBC_00728]|jgi:hypothetical protein|uniref:hypothetical protein n=1 Tax=Streptomyces sp. NBC_00728 TaxID=2903676 RepID=UPI00386DC348
MGIRTLHRRTAMATTVVVATMTVTAAVAPLLLAPMPALAAEAGTAQLRGTRRSSHDEDLDARMSRDLRAALSARPGTVLVAVHGGGPVPSRPGPGDRMRLPAVLTGAHAFLRTRAYALRRVTRVTRVRGGRRGFVRLRLPRRVKTHITTGRLPRAANGGRVHGIGAFTGPARTYRVIVLSYDHPTMPYRARAVERVARAVHRALGRGRGLLRSLTPGAVVSAEPDGSAPYGPPRGLDEPERDATA